MTLPRLTTLTSALPASKVSGARLCGGLSASTPVAIVRLKLDLLRAAVPCLTKAERRPRRSLTGRARRNSRVSIVEGSSVPMAPDGVPDGPAGRRSSGLLKMAERGAPRPARARNANGPVTVARTVTSPPSVRASSVVPRLDTGPSGPIAVTSPSPRSGERQT